MVFNLFKAIILVQLFFSFGITIFSHSMPGESLNFVNSFSDLSDDIDLSGTASQVQGSIEQQKNMPIIELGALVFYSGNIILDLLLNFTFAIPQMLGLVFSGITNLFGIDYFAVAMIQLFASVFVVSFWFISLIQLLANIRAGAPVSG